MSGKAYKDDEIVFVWVDIFGQVCVDNDRSVLEDEQSSGKTSFSVEVYTMEYREYLDLRAKTTRPFRRVIWKHLRFTKSWTGVSL